MSWRSLRDSAAILDALQGAMTGDPYAAPAPQRPYRVAVPGGVDRDALIARAVAYVDEAQALGAPAAPLVEI